MNLANTYVNAFVNAGFCKDKLIIPNISEWISKNKENGKSIAVASIGIIYLWNNI